ncbi:hypothetical protein ACOSQ2_024564 [Xanthoceras sorbifolium]
MPRKITNQEDDYRRQRSNRVILSKKTPDPSVRTYTDKMPDPSMRTYADVMRQQALEKEKEYMLKVITQT